MDDLEYGTLDGLINEDGFDPVEILMRLDDINLEYFCLEVEECTEKETISQ